MAEEEEKLEKLESKIKVLLEECEYELDGFMLCLSHALALRGHDPESLFWARKITDGIEEQVKQFKKGDKS